jgi:hypothetical protein
MNTKIYTENPTEADRAKNTPLQGKAGPRDVVRPGPEAEARLKAIMDGLAETVLNMSDAEIFDEVRMQGRDPVQEAEETRKVLTDALTVVARKGSRPRQPSTQ